MKKLVPIAAMLLVLLMSCTALAASAADKRMGILLIGGAEFKTPEYYDIAKKAIQSKSRSKCEAGNAVQSKYNAYWLEKGFVGEQIPQRQDLIDFTAGSGYGKVLCLVISNSTVDRHNSAKHREKDRVSVQVDAYLCSRTNVLNVYTASHEEVSKGSSLRARRAAFEKCIKEIADAMKGTL